MVALAEYLRKSWTGEQAQRENQDRAKISFT